MAVIVFGGLLVCLAALWFLERGDGRFLGASAVGGSVLGALGVLAGPLLAEAGQGPFFWLLLAGVVAAYLAGSGLTREAGSLAAGTAGTVFLNHWTPDEFAGVGAAGSWLALAGAVGLVVARGLSGGGKVSGMLAGVLGALLMVVAGYFVGRQGGDDLAFPLAVFAGAAVAVLLAYSAREDGLSGAGMGMVWGLVWLGAATFAFSLDKSFALAALGAAGVWGAVLAGRSVVLAGLAPVFGILAFRTLRSVYPDVTRAFDIGQHYALVGLLLGVGAVMLLAEWGHGVGRRSGPAWWGSAGLAALGAGAAVVFSLVFLGAKGGVGLMVGLGMAPVFALVAGKGWAGSVGVSLGLVGLVGTAYGWASGLFEATRSEKTLAASVGALVVLGLVGLVWWMSRGLRVAPSAGVVGGAGSEEVVS